MGGKLGSSSASPPASAAGSICQLFWVAEEASSSELYSGLILSTSLLSKDLVFWMVAYGLEPGTPQLSSPGCV